VAALDGSLLGPRVTPKSFCDLANEGAFRAPASARAKPSTYTFAGNVRFGEAATDCKPFFRSKLQAFAEGKATENWPDIVNAFERSRFRKSNTPYGNGGYRYWLVPWRTVATYNLQFRPGTLLYIPHLRAAKVTLPSGETVQHDGYFLAADAGSGIKTDHLDFFTGGIEPKGRQLLRGVGGEKNAFTAYVVSHPQIIGALKGLHRMN
jgi:3D (Asp-Asp-Asp) domain-containing protein